MRQPPPRGCVLKRQHEKHPLGHIAAASARLCVETTICALSIEFMRQPPPRGCVLKHFTDMNMHMGI